MNFWASKAAPNFRIENQIKIGEEKQTNWNENKIPKSKRKNKKRERKKSIAKPFIQSPIHSYNSDEKAIQFNCFLNYKFERNQSEPKVENMFQIFCC